MPSQTPVRKWIKVWVEKRKNPPKRNGKRTVSYTLEWVEYGKRHFMSLGAGATKSYADSMVKAKEAELNSSTPEEPLKPITWDDFKKKYLDSTYPGHALPVRERRTNEKNWSNSLAMFREERRVFGFFAQIIKPEWCQDVTTEQREEFIQQRLTDVGSAHTVNKDLRILRHLFNVLEEWQHRPKGTNPFSGNGRATVGQRRKKAKEFQRQANGGNLPEFYTRPQIKALLAQADKEVKEEPGNWQRQRLRTLVYFEAYTGARLEEVLYLEWSEIDFAEGIAWLNAKPDNQLKTPGSEAPVGLSDALISVLEEWKQHKTCDFVFPNTTNRRPWTGGGPGYKPLDQLKAMAKRAGIEHANWLMFRHTLTTLGKSWFGLTVEQVKAALRHTTTDTQRTYTHNDLEGLRQTANAIRFAESGGESGSPNPATAPLASSEESPRP